MAIQTLKEVLLPAIRIPFSEREAHPQSFVTRASIPSHYKEKLGVPSGDASYIGRNGFMIADGMGGIEHDSLASRLAMESMLPLVDTDFPTFWHFRQAATDCTHHYRHALRDTQARQGNPTLDTTFTAIVPRDASLWVVHVGDSQFSEILVDNEGEILLQPVTTSHSIHRKLFPNPQITQEIDAIFAQVASPEMLAAETIRFQEEVLPHYYDNRTLRNLITDLPWLKAINYQRQRRHTPELTPEDYLDLTTLFDLHNYTDSLGTTDPDVFEHPVTEQLVGGLLTTDGVHKPLTHDQLEAEIMHYLHQPRLLVQQVLQRAHEVTGFRADDDDTSVLHWQR